MNKEELKFRIKQEWADFIITLKYLVREPYYEAKRLVKGYYNSAMLFWVGVIIFILSWRKGSHKIVSISIIIIITLYIYMFHRSGKAKEYYQKEMMEGKEID